MNLADRASGIGQRAQSAIPDKREDNRAHMPTMTAWYDPLRAKFGRMQYMRLEENGRVVESGTRSSTGGTPVIASPSHVKVKRA